MDLLVNVRDDVGVNKLNPYLFTIPDVYKFYIRDPDALHKNVESTQAITSTSMRKHMTSLSQLLNLQENESELLADYLGYDVTVHREFYRLSEDTLNLAKVEKFLLALEKGVSQYTGKTLNKIEINLSKSVICSTVIQKQDWSFIFLSFLFLHHKIKCDIQHEIKFR